MSNHVFGNKISVKHMCFMIDRDKPLHCAYIPHIEVNGIMMTVKDESAPQGLLQGETRYKARKKAQEVLNKMKESEVDIK